MTAVALVLAVVLYLVAVSVFTYGLLWRRWLIMLGSVVPGGAAVFLLSMTSGLWLPILDPLGGLTSLESLSVLAAVVGMSWLAAVLMFTREGVDEWLIRATERMKSAFRSRRKEGKT